MAQEKYAYGGNTGDLFADDDPLAELARIVGYEQPVPRSAAAQRAEPAFSPQPVRVVSGGRAEPAFDLEDELLKEFERYDAPGLDPSASIAVEPPRHAAPSSFRPAVEERVAPVPVAAPALDNWASLSPEPAAPRYEPDSFTVDLADELELAVSAGDEPVAAPRAGLNLPLSGYHISREEPSFEAAPEPVFVEQAEPAYDVSHFATASARAVQPQIDFSYVPEPVAAPVVEPVRAAPAATPVRKEPELAALDDAIATDEFELALDGLELDLSDIVLSEVASVTPVSKGAQQAVAAPAPEFVWEEPVPAAADLPDEAMPFDASLIAEPDYAPEAIAEMDVPDMPVHEAAAPAAYQPAFDTDFDAEIADLFHDEHAVATAAAATASEAAPVRKPAVDLDDFSFMMNEDFNSVASAQVAAEAGKSRIVIDPDKMEYANVEGETRLFGWKAAALASVAVLVSATGLYAWFSSGGVARLNSADGPPIVVADSEPVKIVPEDPGGKTVPNQDKAVYDRVAGGAPQTPTQKSLISSSEEPMDVVQRTLTPENFPTVRAEDEDMLVEEADERLQPGTGSETAADNPAADANVSLRKVRTMIVRPDGSLVAREVPESAPPAPQQQTAARLPAAAPAQPAAPEVSSEALSQAAASTVTETAARAARPAGNDRAPLPAQRPAEQPVNIVGAVTNEGNIRQAPAQPQQQQQAAAAPSQTAPASSAVPPGTYVVQIASLPSQAEAEKSYRNMSAKYGGIIGGKGVDIKAADIPGKGTYYRVRLVAGAKADADALCAKLKAAGGSCLVTR